MALADQWLMLVLLAAAAPLAAVLAGLRAKTPNEPQNEVDARRPKPKKAARLGKQEWQPKPSVSGYKIKQRADTDNDNDAALDLSLPKSQKPVIAAVSTTEPTEPGQE